MTLKHLILDTLKTVHKFIKFTYNLKVSISFNIIVKYINNYNVSMFYLMAQRLAIWLYFDTMAHHMIVLLFLSEVF